MMMKRERHRTLRRVVGVVVAVTVRSRLRDFCFCLLFLVRLVTICLLGCPSNRARRRDDATTARRLNEMIIFGLFFLRVR